MLKNSIPPISSSGGPDDETKLARMSLLGHDIRAAVSDIIGGLRLVDQTQLDATARLQIERVRVASEVLAQLIEDGLQIVAEETGTGPLPPVRMGQLLYDLEMRWNGQAREKGLSFQIALAPDVPPVLMLDRLALQRVLGNILSNAIKFTDAGGVRVLVALDEPSDLRITVSDDGSGFAPSLLERLFQPGVRGDATNKPGQGLGMYIAKQMTDHLGGQIGVANRPEGGAVVTLVLPVRRPAISERPDPAPLPDLRGLRVLIADDSATNQAVFSHMLGAMGAEVEIAADGDEALARARAGRFDLAVIDIEMPRVSGLELMRVLRTDPSPIAGIPIVACTAYVLRANREAIHAAGADAIVAKPLAGIDALGAAIARAQGRRRAGGAFASDGVPKDDADLDRALFERLLAMAGPLGSAELLTRLIADLSRVERNLVAALALPDFVAIGAEAHVLIAVAGTIGAARLVSEAERLMAASHERAAEQVTWIGRSVLAQVDRLLQFTTRRAGQITGSRA